MVVYMYGTQAYSRYKQMQVTTASPGQLIIMLYDGAIGWAGDGAAAIEAGDTELAHSLLLKAQQALTELASGLDMGAGGAVAENLARLYDFMHSRLVEANVKKDPAAAREAAGMLESLRDSWQQIMNREAALPRAAGGIDAGG